MDCRQNEVEFDELEELLCEIPNVTKCGMNHRSPINLASAFSEMSLSDTPFPKSMQSHTPFPKSMQSYTASLDARFPKKHTFSDANTPLIVVPSFQTPPNSTNLPYDFYGFDVPKCGQERCQLGNYHTVGPRMQFPLMSDHQQTFLESHNQFQYLNPQHQISWRNIDKEQLYEMQLGYLNYQRIHNQQMGSGNTNNRLQSLNTRHEQFKQEPFWNGYAIPKAPIQSNTSFWDKTGKQNYPDGVFGSRSHGLNFPSGVKFGSFGANESIYSTRSLDRTDIKIDDLKTSPLIRYNSLNEVSGRIYLMARDQYGCRFLQRKFAEGTREEVEMIFSEIIDHIVDLMTDPFGNYLVQKLLEVCNEDQLMKILHLITRNQGELVRISCDMHGTRAVQKIIEALKTAEQFSMAVSSLKQNAVVLMKNMNGNHVAQKCLQHLMPEYCDFLFEEATRNCVELATDRHGCCVLQKCLGHSDGDQRSRLICEIAANALFLSQDPFGNYVVQFVFDLKLQWATEKVVENLEGSFGDLSVQKHSSNVVERCLKSASEERCVSIIEELINNPRLDQIMHDPFGNYVTQAALEISKGNVYAKLVEAITPHIAMLRSSPYGKKVLTRLANK